MGNCARYRAFAAVAAAVPSLVFAHTGLGETYGFLHGFMHPIGGMNHVLAMVAVGVIAVQLGGRALWAVPLSFVSVMAIAAFIGMGGLTMPGLETAIALSVIVLGGVIALRLELPVTLATVTLLSSRWLRPTANCVQALRPTRQP